MRDGRAVVEDVDGIAGDFQFDEPGADGCGQVVEGVFHVWRRFRKAEAGEVGGEDVVGVAEERDEVAVLSRRGREAHQEEDCGQCGCAGFYVVDVEGSDAIGVDGEVVVLGDVG